MDKKNKPLVIGVALIVLSVVILGVIMYLRGSNSSELKTSSDVKKMINSIYRELGDTLPTLGYQNINSSTEAWKSYTGLSDSSNVDFIVISEPMMNAQAYSLVVLKVKDKSNIESMKQEMYDNIDMAKWICVSAEKMYITNNDDVIFMVMGLDDWASPVYNSFKKYVNNNIGKELVKTNRGNIDLPLEMPDAKPVM